MPVSVATLGSSSQPQQILGTDRLYIQQVKINAKVAFSGEVWQWHYDFATHHAEDGVPEPLAVNLHLFLDDVTEHNGPLMFIRGSHRQGPVRTTVDIANTRTSFTRPDYVHHRDLSPVTVLADDRLLSIGTPVA